MMTVVLKLIFLSEVLLLTRAIVSFHTEDFFNTCSSTREKSKSVTSKSFILTEGNDRFFILPMGRDIVLTTVRIPSHRESDLSKGKLSYALWIGSLWRFTECFADVVVPSQY